MSIKYVTFLLIAVTSQSFAQSTPSEFAEMSLQELFEQSIHENDVDASEVSPWILTYHYKAAEFEGYVDGTTDLSFDEVLWNGPGEPRTNKNFPVLPTVINQTAQLIGLAYQYDPNCRFNISIPYIEQKTDHISIVSNYDFFIIETKGVGDVSVSTSYNWTDEHSGNWIMSVGVSLPTGSIDEVGDTPRAPGDQQLPYTMQLGSGTYDFPIEVSYHNSGLHNFSLGLSANIRTGKNDRNYRLGNNINFTSRYKINLSESIQTSAGLTFQYSDSIHGRDSDLIVSSPFPYPAGITNPNLYGGKKINLKLGLTWKIADDIRLNIEFGKPLYQNLNGPQPKEKWRSATYISKTI